jgi:hypothetical protein
MAQHAFAVEPQTPSTSTDPIDIPILVNVDFDGNVTVSASYVHVPEGESRTITWSLESELTGVFFDNPAITMFGESPDINWLVTEGQTQKLQWFNTNPAKQHRSFYYRIHLLQKIVQSTGTMYRSLTSDPMIRNDPPPAP